MPYLRTNGDDFYSKGNGYGDAWDILAEGCDVPPSLEGFRHTLENHRSRSRAPITVQQHARLLADTYHRIR